MPGDHDITIIVGNSDIRTIKLDKYGQVTNVKSHDRTH